MAIKLADLGKAAARGLGGSFEWREPEVGAKRLVRWGVPEASAKELELFGTDAMAGSYALWSSGPVVYLGGEANAFGAIAPDVTTFARLLALGLDSPGFAVLSGDGTPGKAAAGIDALLKKQKLTPLASIVEAHDLAADADAEFLPWLAKVLGDKTLAKSRVKFRAPKKKR